MSWTVQKIEEYCKELGRKIGLEFDCPVKINGRLTKTLGRVVSESYPFGLKPVSLEISKKLVNYATDEDIRTVIEHEFCHWAVCVETQESHDHDKVFKAMCRRVGCTGDTPNINIKYLVNEDSLYKYVVKCKECGSTLYFSRAGAVVKNLEEYECGKCGGEFKLIKNW